VINAIRAHLAEFGVTAPVGRKGIEELLRVIADPSDKRVPDVVRACLAALGSQLLSLKKQILDFDRMILAWHRSNQTSKRLNCIPGVGPLLATDERKWFFNRRTDKTIISKRITDNLSGQRLRIASHIVAGQSGHRTKTEHRATILLPNPVAVHDTKRVAMDGRAKILKESNTAQNRPLPAGMAATELRMRCSNPFRWTFP
jgi:hypothetical protein